jgi:carbon storage regulator CsrA
MLVLKRKASETIRLDGGIQIKVLQIGRNMISLGIEAPSEVGIWRGELPPHEPLTSCVAADRSAATPRLVRSA